MVDGSLIITVNHTDSAGNAATPATVSVTKDSAPPVITAFAVTNSSPTNSTTYNLTFTATDSPTQYCILENSTTVGGCSWQNTPLPTSFTVNSTNNAKILTAWLKDAVGNVSTPVNSNSVTLETGTPVAPSALSLTNPSSSPGSDTTPTINVTAGGTLTVMVGGGEAGANVAAGARAAGGSGGGDGGFYSTGHSYNAGAGGGGSSMGATNATAANNTDPDYTNNAGKGGNGNSGSGVSGNPGKVMVIYSTFAIASASPTSGIPTTSIDVTFNATPSTSGGASGTYSVTNSANWSYTCTPSGTFSVTGVSLSGNTATVSVNQSVAPGAGAACTLTAGQIASTSGQGLITSRNSVVFDEGTITCSGTGVTQIDRKCIFAASGNHSVTVTSQKTLTVKAWGAGGGGGSFYTGLTGNNGGGGNAGFFTANNGYNAGAGGGRSALISGGTDLITAGGGGGGPGGYAGAAVVGGGGCGADGLVGQAGGNGDNSTVGGGGGTSSAGESATYGGATDHWEQVELVAIPRVELVAVAVLVMSLQADLQLVRLTHLPLTMVTATTQTAQAPVVQAWLDQEPMEILG